MKEYKEPTDAEWEAEAEARLKELQRNSPCTHEGECADKLLVALLTGQASKMQQLKVGLWLDHSANQLAQIEKDREFARGMVLLIAGPRQKTKPH